MLELYVTDTDLKKYHPKLANQLWTNQATYQTQINEAYDLLLDDLHNRGINPRKLTLPFDLKRTSSDAGYISPVSSTEAVSTTGSSFDANADVDSDKNYRRFVVNATAINGTWTVTLQGSNDNINWENVADASLTLNVAGKQSVSFANQYKWYRYISTAGTSMTYSCYLVETIFDRPIIYKTLALIFSDFRKVDGDSWDKLKIEYDAYYESALKSIKFLYDADDSGSIEDEEETTAGSTTLIW